MKLGRPGLGPVSTELCRAMVARRITQRQLAEEAHVSRDTVGSIACGRKAPRHSTVVRLADVLSWPRLVDVSAKQRLTACVICHRAMVAEGNRTRLYCTPVCRDAAYARRRRNLSALSGVVARHLLRGHQCAVEEMCRQCSPDLVCRVADCPLRPVSPFPLVTKVCA